MRTCIQFNSAWPWRFRPHGSIPRGFSPVANRATPLMKGSCMAIIVKFNKARAEYLVRCLSSGTPINPEQDGWSGNDMLALAGACLFGAMSQGPRSFWAQDIPKNLSAERRQAKEATFFNDLHAAIEFYGHLT